jgi:hypothetical protein
VSEMPQEWTPHDVPDDSEARHELLERVAVETRRLDRLIERLSRRVHRVAFEEAMAAGLRPTELDLLRSGLQDPDFADAGRVRAALVQAGKQRDAVRALGRRLVGAERAATAGKPAKASPRADSPPPPREQTLEQTRKRLHEAQLLCASAGTASGGPSSAGAHRRRR